MIDHSRLTAISRGDPEEKQAILAEFRRLNDEDAAQLRAYVATGELDRVTHFSHRIRGSCAMLGVVVLQDVCRCIEDASRSADASALVSLLADFEREMRLLGDCLDELQRPEAAAA